MPGNKPPPPDSPAQRYDKILKENLLKAVPGILFRTAGLRLNDLRQRHVELQQTRERKADFVGSAIDDAGHECILHVEFQAQNDRTMLYRMLEYKALLRRKYPGLPIRQFVIALSAKPPRMPDCLDEPDHFYRYRLLWLRGVPYRNFLQASHPEEALLTILADFGTDAPEAIATELVERLRRRAQTPLEFERLGEQLRVLANLRNLQPLISTIMEKARMLFDEKRDPFYRKGKKEGKLEGKLEAARALFQETDLAPEKIAEILGVDLALVLAIRDDLRGDAA